MTPDLTTSDFGILMAIIRTLALRLAREPVCIVLILACGACSADRIDSAIVRAPFDNVSRTLSVAVGQELLITLGNVGPAEFESPPEISSSALAFLTVNDIPPYTPAGPNQQFSFKAVSALDTSFTRMADPRTPTAARAGHNDWIRK